MESALVYAQIFVVATTNKCTSNAVCPGSQIGRHKNVHATVSATEHNVGGTCGTRWMWSGSEHGAVSQPLSESAPAARVHACIGQDTPGGKSVQLSRRNNGRSGRGRSEAVSQSRSSSRPSALFMGRCCLTEVFRIPGLASLT